MSAFTIYPYRLGDCWVFDDARTGLKEEAFVLGSSEMMTRLVEAKGTKPVDYPAIDAVADGVAGRIDTRFGLPGGNDRYGVVISACISSRMPRHDPERWL